MGLNQNGYHFGQESGTESTYPVLAAQNFPVTYPPGRAILCRVNVQADGTAHSNTSLTWQYRHTPKATGTPGAWTNITTTSAVLRTGATAVFANNANCTKRLSGTGTFEASGAGCTHDGTSGGAANDIVANGCSETVIGVQVINADTAVGDLIEVRVVNGGGTPLTTYDRIPTIRVAANILPIQARDTSEQVSVSAAVAKIRDTQVCFGVVGLSASDLADATLAFTFTVWGTTIPGSTDPADYTVPISGPDGFACGATGKAGTKYGGMNIPPEYCFVADVPEGVRRVLAKVTASKSVTWGLDATVTGDV